MKVPVRCCSQRVELPSWLGYLRKQMPGRCCHRNTLIAAMRHRQHVRAWLSAPAGLNLGHEGRTGGRVRSEAEKAKARAKVRQEAKCS